MKLSLFIISFILLLSACGTGKEIIKPIVFQEQSIADTIFHDQYKLSAEDSVWHDFYLIKLEDSITFSPYFDHKSALSYTFHQVYNCGQTNFIPIRNFDSISLPLSETYSITNYLSFENSRNESNLAFELLNDSILFIEHWMATSFADFPYYRLDEYGENIDSLDEEGQPVYPPPVEGYKKSQLININTKEPVTELQFSTLLKSDDFYYCFSGTSVLDSYISTLDQTFKLITVDSTVRGFVKKPAVLKAVINDGGKNHQLVDPTQAFGDWEKYIPVYYEKDNKTALFNLRKGEHLHPLSPFSMYHPEKYVGLYFKNDSLFPIRLGHFYLRNTPFAINDMDSLARSPSFGLFHPLTDTIPEHSPMHHQWIFNNEKIEGTYWDHNRPVIYLIEPKLAYVYNRILEEYQTEINEYGEIAYDDNGEVIKVGENFPGRYDSGIFDFEQLSWVIPAENLWVMHHGDKYIAKKPILDEKGLYVGATYDLYTSDFEKYKSAVNLKELPEEFRQLMRKRD